MLQEWPDTGVTCAGDGLAGARKLRNQHYDLALVDGSLRGFSGIELAEVAANENIPVLVLSGHPDINATAAAFGFPHLAKPFSIKDLLACSKQEVARASENVARVKASAALLQASLEKAKQTVARSQALVAKLNRPEAVQSDRCDGRTEPADKVVVSDSTSPLSSAAGHAISAHPG
jgi:DNA-binding response OmpR family regulator